MLYQFVRISISSIVMVLSASVRLRNAKCMHILFNTKDTISLIFEIELYYGCVVLHI